MISWVLVTPPATEPVSLAEFKQAARIDNDQEDALLSSLITAARLWIEKTTGQTLIEQDWTMWVDVPPKSETLTLAKAPLISISEIAVFAEDGSFDIWESSNYFVDAASMPGRLALKSNTVWPSPWRYINGMSIACKVGYGTSSDDVPEPLRVAILQLATYWYENRGDQLQQGLGAAIPLSVLGLVQPYRLRVWGRS